MAIFDESKAAQLRAIGAGQTIRAGLKPVDKGAPGPVQRQQEIDGDEGWRFRSLSLEDAAREANRITLGESRIPQDRVDAIREAVSGGSLSYVFDGVVGAQLMQSYEEETDSTAGWCRETDVKDFKVQPRIRITANADLQKLAKGGKATHAAPSDTAEEYKIARYARQFSVDEMDIIDDNLNALTTMPEAMGAAARRLRPDLVYAILLANDTLVDGVALFDASTHVNLMEASSALSASTVQDAIVKMATQTENGRNLNIAPRWLVVPHNLIFAARIILQSGQRIIAADSNGDLNPLLEEGITPRSDNRIGTAGVTDPNTGTAYVGTATNWFMFASPVQAPTIEVGYLRGTNRRPVIRSFVLDRGQWGVGWDVKLDIGAKALDYRGCVKATGAS